MPNLLEKKSGHREHHSDLHHSKVQEKAVHVVLRNKISTERTAIDV